MEKASFNLKKYSEAERVLFIALDKAKISNALNYEKEIYELLSSLYSKVSKHDLAYEYLLKSNKIRDSFHNEETEKAIIELREKYETKIKEIENKELKKSLETKTKQLYYTVTICLLIAFIIFFLIRNKVIKSKANTRIYIKEKNKALERIDNLKHEIQEKNELIKELENQETKITIDSNFSKKLTERLTNEKNWAQFVIEFELIYPSFFKNLMEKSPNLTNNDQRFLALLKLKLTDKEIASLLNMEYNSVRRKKYALKEKIGNSSLDDLIN